jgi:hypothetical protein
MFSRECGRGRWALVFLAALVFAAGCSAGSGHPQPGPSGKDAARARYSSAPALLAQCAISRSVAAVATSARKYNQLQPAGQRWLTGTKVEVTSGNGSSLTDWMENGGGAATVVGGRSLGYWQRWAAVHDRLPKPVCGAAVSGPAARLFYRQVYAQWPAELANDPW